MVNVNHIGDSITGSVKGKSFGVAYSPEKFKQLQELAGFVNEATTVADYTTAAQSFLDATVEDFTTTVETACPNIHVNKATGEFFLKQGDKVSVHAMPKSFAARVLESVEKGIDVSPMIKFWTRTLRNPYFSPKKAKKICNYVAKTYVDYELVNTLQDEHGVSKEVAQERATSIQTPITMEGLLCTYKVSTELLKKFTLDADGNKVLVDRYVTTKSIDEDSGVVTSTTATPEYVEERVFEPAVMGTGGDEFYCGDKLGHQIKVGQRHYLAEWSQVNTDDNHSCVKGLHVGNLDYIKGYQNSGTVTHQTFVDPMYIGAVTNDGSGALRVKEYFTYDSFAGVLKSLYHSSTYAAMTDAAWEVMRTEAIASANKIKSDVEADIAAITEQE